MYAIVQVGGRQYRAAPGERMVVDRLDVEPGSRVHLSDVRMLHLSRRQLGPAGAGSREIGDHAAEGAATSKREH